MVIEIKNTHIVLLGLLLTFALALLPSKGILLAAIAVPILGSIALLIRGGIWAMRDKGIAATAIVLLLLLTFAWQGVLLIGGLVYLLVALVMVFLLPTAINLGMSYLAIQVLPKRFWLTIPAFLIVSLVLAFNVRIPAMLSDEVGGTHRIWMTKQIRLTQEEPLLLVSNVEKISFRESPFASISFGGNEGCGCFYWVYPTMITEGIEDALQRRGIRYTKNGNARYKLVIDSKEVGGVMHLAISLWDGAVKTASYDERFRSYHFYEQAFHEHRASNLDYLPYRFLFLAQNNLWNYILASGSRLKSKTPILDFLVNAIDVATSSSDKKITSVQQIKTMGVVETLPGYHPYIKKQDYLETVGLLDGGCEGRIESGLRYDSKRDGSIGLTGNNVIFKYGGERFSVLLSRDLERVICIDDAIYVIGSIRNQEVRIQKFSQRGDLLSDVLIALPRMTFLGFPRKRVVDFSETGSGYEFTLLDIAEESHYYTVKGAYRVGVVLNEATQQGTGL